MARRLAAACPTSKAAATSLRPKSSLRAICRNRLCRSIAEAKRSGSSASKLHLRLEWATAKGPKDRHMRRQAALRWLRVRAPLLRRVGEPLNPAKRGMLASAAGRR